MTTQNSTALDGLLSPGAEAVLVNNTSEVANG